MATTNVPQIQFSATGYVSPSAPSVLQGVQLDINSAFGQNLNFGLTTPQGQLSSSWGAIIANCNAQFVFLSQMMDPAYSVGKWQDGIGRIYYMTRKASQPTSLQISCAGANGVQIPLNALVQDNHSDGTLQHQWDEAPDALKALMVKRIISDFRSAAKKQILREYPDIDDAVQAQLQTRAGQLTGSR